MSKKNNKLISNINKLKLSNHIKLLGQNNNISEVMNAIDIHVLSSSYGEGFPNVVAEAMACGTPCIATDVGDSALLIGKTGWVVPPKNPIKLAKAIEKALNEQKTLKWNKRCTNARLRIRKKFGISRMINLYNKIWNKVCKESSNSN